MPKNGKYADAVQRWSAVMEEYGMKVNLMETETIVISKTLENIYKNIHINGQEIKTNLMKYLGCMFECRGHVECDIDNRLRNAAKLFNALKTPFFKNKEVNKTTKVKMYTYKTVLV